MGKQRAARAFSRWEQQQKQSQNRRQRRMEEQEEIRLQAAVRAAVGPTPDLTYQNFRSGMQLLADNAQRVTEAVQNLSQTPAIRQIIEASNNPQPIPSLLSTMADSTVNLSRVDRQVRPVDTLRGPVYLEAVSISQGQWEYVRDMNRGRMSPPARPAYDFEYLEGCPCDSCITRRNMHQAEIERGYGYQSLVNQLPPGEAQRLYQNEQGQHPYLDYSRRLLVIPGGAEITFEAMSQADTESSIFKRWLFFTVPMGLQQEVRNIISQLQARTRRLPNAERFTVNMTDGQQFRSASFESYLNRRIAESLMVPGPVLQRPELSSASAYEGMVEAFNRVRQFTQPKPKPAEEIDQMRAKVARAQKLLQDTSQLLSRVVAGLEVTPEEAKALKARVDAGVEAFK